MLDSGLVRDYFIRSADTFDALYAEKRMSHLRRFINKAFRRDIYERFLLSMAHVQRHTLRSVLDVGCGSGRYAVALADLDVPRVVGVDFSPRMIELALQHTAHLRAGGRAFDFVCADFMECPPGETFDLVLAMGFFDYIRDPVPVLKKMRTFAAHSVIASFPSRSFYRTPLRRVRYALKRCPVFFYTPRRIEGFSREAGFARCEITKIKGAGMDYVAAFYA